MDENENSKIQALLKLTNDEIRMAEAFKVDSEKEVNRLQLQIKDYDGQISALTKMFVSIEGLIEKDE